MAYLSLLKTKSTEDVLNLPLKALQLAPSSLSMLTNARIILKEGVATPYFRTVKDVIDYGKDSLMSFLCYKPNARYHDVKETIMDLEECLAKLGLKMKDSDFTVGDIRVSSLDVTESSAKLLRKIGIYDKTIDDLIFYGHFKLTQSTDKKRVIKNIEESLEKFGLKLEGSPRVLNKAKRFPIAPYTGYLSKEAVNKYVAIRKKSAQKKPKIDAEKYLQSDVKNLRFRTGVIADFISRKGFKTIQDLVNYGEEAILAELDKKNLYLIQNVLAKRGIILKGSEVVLDGTRVVRSVSQKPNGYLKSNVSIIDFQTLSPVEQSKFLNKTIDEFGFVDSILNEIHKNDKFKTIRDLVNSPRKKLVEEFGAITANKVIQTLNKFNIDVVKAVYNVRGKKIINEDTFVYGLDYSKLSDEEKKEFNSRKLEDVGFGEDFISSIQKVKPDAKVFGDVIDFTIRGMRANKIPRDDIRRFVSIMAKYGIVIEEGEKFYRSAKEAYKKKPKFSAETLLDKYKTAEELKNLPIDVLCLSTEHRKILESAQIKTIGDICNFSFRYITVKLDNRYLVAKLGDCLSKLNLKYANSIPYSKKKEPVEPLSISRDELLKSQIFLLNITPVVARKLLNAGIDTVEKLVASTNKDLAINGLNRPNITQVKQKLNVYGLDLSRLTAKPGEGKRPMKVKPKIVEPMDVKALSKSEQAEFMEKDVQEIGIPERLANKLKSLGVLNVGMMTNLAYSDYFSLGLRHYSIKTIKQKLGKYNLGLLLKPRFGHVQTNNPSNLNHDVKNYKRKMSHLYRYINYIKSRDNNILEKEDELF